MKNERVLQEMPLSKTKKMRISVCYRLNSDGPDTQYAFYHHEVFIPDGADAVFSATASIIEVEENPRKKSARILTKSRGNYPVNTN